MSTNDICAICGQPLSFHYQTSGGPVCPTRNGFSYYYGVPEHGYSDALGATMVINSELRAELERVTKERDEANERLVSQCAFTGELQAEIAKVNRWRDDAERIAAENARLWADAYQRADELRGRMVEQNALIVQGDKMRLQAQDAASFWHKKCLEAREEVARFRVDLESALLDRDDVVDDWETAYLGASAAVDDARSWALRYGRAMLAARAVAAYLATKLEYSIFDSHPELFVEDDFGSAAFKWCEHCGGDVQIIRPGDARCVRCGK